MYTQEQLAAIALDHAKEIAALWEHSKSAHKRIDENDSITAGIHELAKNIAEMAVEIKALAKSTESSINRVEQGQKQQGERIGNIEKAIMSISRNEKTLDEHEKRLDEIDKAPADKWNKFTWLIIAGVAAAVVAFIMARLL